MPVYLIVTLAVLALALDALVAAEFQKIVFLKGWTSKKYFFYSFFLLFVGYMMVIALPDHSGLIEGSYESGDLPEL